MIHVQHNNRHLSIRFCYSKRYGIDVPIAKEVLKKASCKECGCSRQASAHREIKDKYEGKTVRVAPHHKFRPNIDSHFERVERPLTQCYIEEGVGKDKRIIAKCEKKLYFRDKAFDRHSESAELLRKQLIKYAMASAGDQLSKDEKRILWHAFLTRHTSKANILPPDGGGNIPSTTSKGMRSTRTPAPPPSEPDTVPAHLRVVHVPQERVRRSTPPSPDGHSIITFPAGRWNYGTTWPDLQTKKEIVH